MDGATHWIRPLRLWSVISFSLSTNSIISDHVPPLTVGWERLMRWWVWLGTLTSSIRGRSHWLTLSFDSKTVDYSYSVLSLHGHRYDNAALLSNLRTRGGRVILWGGDGDDVELLCTG